MTVENVINIAYITNNMIWTLHVAKEVVPDKFNYLNANKYSIKEQVALYYVLLNGKTIHLFWQEHT